MNRNEISKGLDLSKCVDLKKLRETLEKGGASIAYSDDMFERIVDNKLRELFMQLTRSIVEKTEKPTKRQDMSITLRSVLRGPFFKVKDTFYMPQEKMIVTWPESLHMPPSNKILDASKFKEAAIHDYDGFLFFWQIPTSKTILMKHVPQSIKARDKANVRFQFRADGKSAKLNIVDPNSVIGPPQEFALTTISSKTTHIGEGDLEIPARPLGDILLWLNEATAASVVYVPAAMGSVRAGLHLCLMDDTKTSAIIYDKRSESGKKS